MRISVNLLVAALMLTSLSSCSTTKKTRVVSNSEAVETQYTVLGEYLRGVPGVQVTQSGGTYLVRIRGAVGTGDLEPLFVVGKVQAGGYEQAASIVDPNDIDDVVVLKDVSSTQAYGMRGANGVIIIRLKE